MTRIFPRPCCKWLIEGHPLGATRKKKSPSIAPSFPNLALLVVIFSLHYNISSSDKKPGKYQLCLSNFISQELELAFCLQGTYRLSVPTFGYLWKKLWILGRQYPLHLFGNPYYTKGELCNTVRNICCLFRLKIADWRLIFRA